MAIVKSAYIKILMTEPERHEKVVMDGKLPAMFKDEGEAERWLVKNEDELVKGAYYTTVTTFKTDKYDTEPGE